MMAFVVLVALIIATITDVKKQEIPLWDFPVTLVIYLIINEFNINYSAALISMTIVAIVFFLLAIFCDAGGGDIIMMSCLAFILQLQTISIVIILSSIFCGVYYIISKKHNSPFAPFVLLGYLVYLIGGIL